jgi:hypothetical protein
VAARFKEKNRHTRNPNIKHGQCKIITERYRAERWRKGKKHFFLPSADRKMQSGHRGKKEQRTEEKRRKGRTSDPFFP